jgi:hypothetical protein
VPALAIFLASLYFWLPTSAIADDFGVAVKSAAMQIQGDSYMLSAEFDYQLSMRAKEALENGVPLFWVIQVKIQQRRDFLWNKTLSESFIRHKIQYHALLNMYRVRNEHTSEVSSFSTLTAALDSISTVRDFSVLPTSALVQDRQYIAAVQVKLDRDSLPLPLRPIAYINPQWYLSSPWYVWSLTN